MIDDKEERERIARILGGVVDRIAIRHAGRKTQEPQVTPRIGQALEDAQLATKETLSDGALRGDPLPGYDIRITTQDIPDRGPGALEKPSGSDLYVNVSVRTGERYASKAFLVQAKKGEGDERLAEQCRKMLARSDSAYAWIFGKAGCSVIDAQTIDTHPDSDLGELSHRGAAAVFEAILECSEGDVALGLPDVEDEDAALDDVLDRLRASTGVSFVLTPPREQDRRVIVVRGPSQGRIG